MACATVAGEELEPVGAHVRDLDLLRAEPGVEALIHYAVTHWSLVGSQWPVT